MGRGAWTSLERFLAVQLHIRPEAESDVREAYTWYVEQGQGQAFLAAIEEILHRIHRSPQMYLAIHRHVRRALVKRFRFAIFYVLQPERIVVLAIMHQSRDPAH